MDFFEFAERKFDVVVLSLVLNFVPALEDRGRMLLRAAELLAPGGLMLLVLPSACVENSRYCKFGLLERILRSVGLPLADGTSSKSSYRVTDKLFFAVCKRTDDTALRLPPRGASITAGYLQ